MADRLDAEYCVKQSRCMLGGRSIQLESWIKAAVPPSSVLQRRFSHCCSCQNETCTNFCRKTSAFSLLKIKQLEDLSTCNLCMKVAFLNATKGQEVQFSAEITAAHSQISRGGVEVGHKCFMALITIPIRCFLYNRSASLPSSEQADNQSHGQAEESSGFLSEEP